MHKTAQAPRRISGWKECKLEELLVGIQPGFARRPSDNAKVAHLRTNNISPEGRLDLSEIKHVRTTKGEIKKYQLVRGDVLFNNTNSDVWVGKTAFVDRDLDALYSNHLTRLRVHEERVDPRFLAIYLHKLQQDGFFKSISTRWVNQTAVNTKALRNVSLRVPPLDEQRRIVATFVRADRLKQNRVQANQLIGKIIQSVFLKMFGDEETITKSWEWRTVEDCMDTIIDYRGKTPPKTSSGIPLITAKIVRNGEILRPDEFISPDFYDKWMVRGFPKYGDVLFTSEAPLGNVAQLELKEKIALAQRIILLRGKEKVIDNKFLVHALLYPKVREDIESRATGSTVKGIRQAQLRKVKIPVPPLDLQNRFGQLSEKIQYVRQNQLRSTQEINELFHSLMHKAFTGELGDNTQIDRFGGAP